MEKEKLPSEKALAKRARVRKGMYATIVNTPTGRRSLGELVEKVGVKSKIAYWNFATVKSPNVKAYEEKKKIHDYGIVFMDGFAVRHVERSIYAYLRGVDVVEIRERKW